MAKQLDIGVSNVARKGKAGWIGVSGVARKIKKMWIGIANIAREFFGGGDIAFEKAISNPLGFSYDYWTGGAIGDYAVFASMNREYGHMSPSLTYTKMSSPSYGDGQPAVGELKSYLLFKHGNSAWSHYVNTSLTRTDTSNWTCYPSYGAQLHDRSLAIFWGNNTSSVSNAQYPLLVNNSLTHTQSSTSHGGTSFFKYVRAVTWNEKYVGFAFNYGAGNVAAFNSSGTATDSGSFPVNNYTRGTGTKEYMFLGGGCYSGSETVYNSAYALNTSLTVSTLTLSVARVWPAVSSNDEQAIFAGGALNGYITSNVGYASCSAVVDKYDKSLTRTTLPAMSKTGYATGSNSRMPCAGGRIFIACDYGYAKDYMYIYSA